MTDTPESTIDSLGRPVRQNKRARAEWHIYKNSELFDEWCNTTETIELLEEHHGISKATTRRALNYLESQGIIEIRRGEYKVTGKELPEKPPPREYIPINKNDMVWERLRARYEALGYGLADNKRHAYIGQFPEKRLVAFDRSAGICQFCGMALASDAHHWAHPKLYPHGDYVEANDLTALCKPCHDIATKIRYKRSCGLNVDEIQDLYKRMLNAMDYV